MLFRRVALLLLVLLVVDSTGSSSPVGKKPKKVDHYKTLSIEKGASDKEIRKAYRELSREFHPDKQVGKSEKEAVAAEKQLQRIQLSFEILSDEERRKHYDKYGFDELDEESEYFNKDTIDFYEFDKKIINLTPTNIHKLWEQTHIMWLVEYYASWCGPCRAARIEYRKMVRKLQAAGKKVRVAAVNCHKPQNQDICNQAGIQAYPSVVLFPKGTQGQPNRPLGVLMQNPEKNEESLMLFVETYLTNEVIELTQSGKNTYETVVVQSKQPSVLVYGQPFCGPCQMLDGPLRQLAKAVKPYAAVTHIDCQAEKPLCDEHGVFTVPVIVLAKPAEGRPVSREILWPPKDQQLQVMPAYTLQVLEQVLALTVAPSQESDESADASEGKDEL